MTSSPSHIPTRHQNSPKKPLTTSRREPVPLMTKMPWIHYVTQICLEVRDRRVHISVGQVPWRLICTTSPCSCVCRVCGCLLAFRTFGGQWERNCSLLSNRCFCRSVPSPYEIASVQKRLVVDVYCDICTQNGTINMMIFDALQEPIRSSQLRNSNCSDATILGEAKAQSSHSYYQKLSARQKIYPSHPRPCIAPTFLLLLVRHPGHRKVPPQLFSVDKSRDSL